MRVAQLWRFPVKSLAGEQLDRVDVGDHGIVGDRGWGILDVASGKVLTARREPQLLFGRAALGVGAGSVTLSLHDGSALDDDSALSDWLGRKVRLVRATAGQHATFETVVDFEHEGTSDWAAWTGPEGSFHDSGRTQMSILSMDTMRDWDLRRFRANVILDEGPEDELIGSSIEVGSVACDIVKAIDRCVMTTRPQPGLPRDLDVLRTINRERDSLLGISAIVRRIGSIEVGDTVEVVATLTT